MTKVLNVFLLNHFVGELTQDENGNLEFQYDKLWLVHKKAIPLSNALPLDDSPFPTKTCKAFFGGILPEAEKRERIAKNLGISEKNDFSMLAEIGGECAGAVSFLPEGEQPRTSELQYRKLTTKKLVTILDDLPRRPLMAGEEGIRLSLAGAQDKIVIHQKNGIFSIPLYGAPSTHILKPAIENLNDTVINEAVCMKLAKAVRMHVARVEILEIENRKVLSVERYDRHIDIAGKINRLHQEDFCQALAVISENKYQNEGGVSLKQAFNLVRERSTVPALDLEKLLNIVIFNFLIGNNDAHGKNFSLLYEDGTVRLAPFYDLLSTRYYPELAAKMAMKIGGQYLPDDVYPRHFEKFADDAELNKPMVIKRVGNIAANILDNLDMIKKNIPGSEKIIDFIASQVTYLKNKF